MKAWQWTGAVYEPCQSVPLSDRAFRYGMSVFESLRVNPEGADFFERHLSRLISACAERGFTVEEDALAAAQPLLVGSELSGFARLYVTAGDGAPADAADDPRIFLFLEQREAPDAEDGWEIGLHDDTYSAPFGGLKTGNYWFNCDALARARERGLDEALLFNDRAELVSACTANVFVLRGEKLCTPLRSSGARAGVIREWVIGRRKVQERRLRREDVVNADEIFLTNSWIGVQPVATLEGRPLGHRSVGPKLAAELEQRRVI